MNMRKMTPYISKGSFHFPYSRGILAKSLMQLGLHTDLAYEIAVLVGEQLDEKNKQYVPLPELKNVVYEVLKKELSLEAAESYRVNEEFTQRVMISSKHGKAPYSRWTIAQTLKTAGLSVGDAAQAGKDIELSLLRENIYEISHKDLKEYVANYLAECYGSDYADKYLLSREIRAKVSPIIILIGGSTGSGKSTIARKLASRFEIGRLVSTDIIRQVMRTIFTKEMMPFLHYSSYNAYEILDIPLANESDKVLVAFREQARQVMVGINALIDRAFKENIDIIVEGVHVVPGMLHPRHINNPKISSFIVITDDEEAHRSHFSYRESETINRRAERYLKYFDSIRQIQDFIQERAQFCQIPAVDNVNLDKSIREAVHLVTNQLVQVVD